MAAPPSSSRRAAWIAGAAGLLLLALLITMLTVHTDRCARDFDARVINAQPGLTAPRFFLDNDSYAWLVHARDLMDSGDWRIRHTFMDNTPYGRPLHWSHPILWGLRGMTALFVQWNGWSRARSLDLAGVWIMPLFQFLILSPVFVLLLRKTGWATLHCLSCHAWSWSRCFPSSIPSNRTITGCRSFHLSFPSFASIWAAWAGSRLNHPR